MPDPSAEGNLSPKEIVFGNATEITWGTEPMYFHKWLTNFPPKGLNIARFTAGLAVNTIHDDRNVFQIISFGRNYPNYPADELTQMAKAQHQYLNDRLAWETSLSELPNDLRTKLQEVQTFINDPTNSNWSDLDIAQRCYNKWNSIVQQMDAQLQSPSDKEMKKLEEARKYFMQFQFRPGGSFSDIFNRFALEQGMTYSNE